MDFYKLPHGIAKKKRQNLRYFKISILKCQPPMSNDEGFSVVTSLNGMENGFSLRNWPLFVVFVSSGVLLVK